MNRMFTAGLNSTWVPPHRRKRESRWRLLDIKVGIQIRGEKKSPNLVWTGQASWVPTRYPADALKKFGWIQQHTGKSVTELEVLHGVLQNRQMRGRALTSPLLLAAEREVSHA